MINAIQTKDYTVKPVSLSCARLAGVLLAAFLLAGCVSDQSFREAREMIDSGRTEAGMARIEELLAAHPGNPEYRTYYLRQQAMRSGRLVAQGQAALANADLLAAETAFRQALTIDRNQPQAQMGLQMVEEARRHQASVRQAGHLAEKQPEAALALLRTVLSENPAHAGALDLKRRIEAERHQAQLMPPRLSVRLQKPVSMQFRDALLVDVFEALSKLSGLSFVFDKDVPAGAKVTLFANQMSIEDALTVLLTTSQLDKKVLSENAILVYPNNPAKKADYQENIVKSFYIGNADPKQTMNLVKAMARSRDVFIDEKLGLLTVRDSLENIRIIERLIAAQDLVDPEVLLDVEVLEVSSSRLQNLGIQYPGQVALTPFSTNPALVAGSTVVQSGTAQVQSTSGYLRGTTTMRELGHLTSGRVLASIGDPGVIINLKAQDGATNLLANPRIRVKNREKAKIRIGDKVPVVTTTTASTGVSTESVQYLDVGLALDVDPIVHPDNQVSIKMALEVSNVVKEITSKTGLLTYQIGTRRAETVLRLKDGETQVLAGLISDEERSSGTKLPGVGELPLIGRLFGSQKDDSQRSEIVLAITPRIVRTIRRPDLLIAEFESGTANSIGTPALRLGTAEPQKTKEATTPAPAAVTPAAPAPNVSAPAAPPSPTAAAPAQKPQAQATAIPAVSPTAAPAPASTSTNNSPAAGNEANRPRSGAVVTPIAPVSVVGAPPAATGAPVAVAWQMPAQVKAGEQFSAVLKLTSQGPLRGLPMLIGFDPQALQVVSAQEGDFFKQAGGQTNFSHRVDAAQGKVFVAIVRQGSADAGINGNTGVLTVAFKAIKAGQTKIQLLSATPEPAPATPIKLPLEQVIKIQP